MALGPLIKRQRPRWVLVYVIRRIESVGYIDMLSLIDAARLVVTDFGGLQKEAYFVGTPCVTVRTETEWPELVDAGWNRLVPPVGREASRQGSPRRSPRTCRQNRRASAATATPQRSSPKPWLRHNPARAAAQVIEANAGAAARRRRTSGIAQPFPPTASMRSGVVAEPGEPGA